MLPIEESRRSLDVVRQPSFGDLKSHATAYYLSYHVRTLDDSLDVSKGVVDDLAPVWSRRADCPVLDLAKSRVALAVFSRAQRHPPAAQEASILYYKLLRLAQSKLLTLHRGNVDICLLAVFTMSRYEDVVYRPPSNPTPSKSSITAALPSFSHHDGALAILRLWKDNYSHIGPGSDGIRHTRGGLIRSALMRHSALPDWMQDGEVFGECGLELEYDRLIVRIINVRQRLNFLLQQKPDLQQDHRQLASIAQQLDKESRSIDRTMQGWRAHFTSTWHYQQHTLRNLAAWPMDHFYSPVVYSYNSPAYAAVYNYYFATRLLLYSTRLKLIQFMSSEILHGEVSSNLQQEADCLSQMNAMATDLAASIPSSLERFEIKSSSSTDLNPSSSDRDLLAIVLKTNEEVKPYLANLVVWPLTIASGVAHGIEAGLGLWFKSEMARLGRIIGIGVLEHAEEQDWLHL